MASYAVLSWIVTIPLIQDRLHESPVAGFSYFVPDQPSFMAFWRNEEGRLPQRAAFPRAFITEPLRVQRDLIDREYAFLEANAKRAHEVLVSRSELPPCVLASATLAGRLSDCRVVSARQFATTCGSTWSNR